MRKFIKFFLFFHPTAFSPLIDSFIRTENLPYSFLYINYKKKLSVVILGFLLPLIFFIHSYLIYGFEFQALKYSIVFYTFLSGLWIISDESKVKEIIKIAKVFFWFFIILAAIQQTQIFEFLDILIEKIFPRATMGVLHPAIRSTLLFTEPARAGYHLLFTFLLAYGFNNKKIIPIIAVLLVQIFMFKSVSALSLTIFYLVMRYPLRAAIPLILLFIIYIGLQIFELPTINHYKWEYIVQNIKGDLSNLITVLTIFDGGRVDGLLNSFKLMLLNPFGALYDPANFISTSGLMSVSAPIMFIRSFGIFGIFYLLYSFSTFGKGKMYRAFRILALASLFSPNGSWLILLLATIEYKGYKR